VRSDFVRQIHFVNGVSVYSTNVILYLEGPPESLGFRVRLGFGLGLALGLGLVLVISVRTL